MYIISRRVSRASRSAFERFHPCQTGFPQIILLCVWLNRQPSLVKIRFIIADLARSIARRSLAASERKQCHSFFIFLHSIYAFLFEILLALGGLELHYSTCARLIKHFSHKILIKNDANVGQNFMCVHFLVGEEDFYGGCNDARRPQMHTQQHRRSIKIIVSPTALLSLFF